jgi:3-oxoacyl-[acyl-carrier protein] reductase
MQLEDKIAIVTGSAQGIGEEIALVLAEEGAHVVVTDINLEGVESTASEVEKRGRKALPLKVNVADMEESEQMVQETVKHFGRIDIMVNNAGITRDTLLLRMREEHWDQVMNVNLKGTFNCTKAAVKIMFRQKSGRLINIASVTGAMGNSGQANYSASKAGVIGFTKAVAREYAGRGITVNAVAPGFIETQMTHAIPDKERKTLISQIPSGRLGSPRDVADAVLFLASDASSYITGQVLHVNGGLYM